MEVAGGTEWTLYPTPGCETKATSTESPNRAALAHKAQAWFVQGQMLKEIQSDYTLVDRGTMAQDGNPAQLVTNGDGGQQLLAASGSNAYLLDLLTNTFTTVLTAKATQIGMLDGYFLALDTTTSTLYLSDLLDGTTWDPTQFAQRSTAPDPWVAMKVAGQRVWLLGSRTSEVWYNAGSFPFPFAPFPGVVIQQGCAAPFSVTEAEGAVLWLAQNSAGARTVQMASGLAPQRISTHALEHILAQYPRVNDAEGEVYQEEGHTFYILTIPSANVTWAYDVTESAATGQPLWHRRGTWNSLTSQYDAWRPRFHAYQFNAHLVGDRTSGVIATMSIANGMEIGGGPIRRLRRPPVLSADLQHFAVPELELIVETGLGTTSGQGADPQILLRTSQNGGKTWSGFRARSVGKTGEYDTRVRWLRNGRGRMRQDEWVFTDPIPLRILGGVFSTQGEAGGR